MQIRHATSEGPSGTLVPRDRENKFDRRLLLRGAAGLGAAAALAAVGITELTPRSDAKHPNSLDNKTGTNNTTSKVVTLEQAEAALGKLPQHTEFPDGVDPTPLFGLNKEQLEEVAGVKITTENQNDQKVLANDSKNAVELFVRAGNTELDLASEQQQGVPIGVRGENGQPVTNSGQPGHAAFVNEHYGQPMLEGMCPDDLGSIGVVDDAVMTVMQGVKDDILKQQARAAAAFEWDAVRLPGSIEGNPTLNTRTDVILIDTQYMDVNLGGFSALKPEQRLKLHLQIKQSDGGPTNVMTTISYKEDPKTGKYLMLFEDWVETGI